MRTDLTGADFRTRLRSNARKLRALAASDYPWFPRLVVATPAGVIEVRNPEPPIRAGGYR